MANLCQCFGQVILCKKQKNKIKIKILFIARQLVGWHKIYHFSYQESQAMIYENSNTILPEVWGFSGALLEGTMLIVQAHWLECSICLGCLEATT